MTDTHVRLLLRLEGLIAMLGGVVVFWWLGGPWLAGLLLFLAPDLSFAGYLLGPRGGAWIYNAAHSYLAPALLGTVAWGLAPAALPFAALWVAHIGMDRVLGYGLKLGSFRQTHLGPI